MSRENPVALFLCGLACTAKSTTLHTIAKKHKVNVLFNDYYELSQQHPEFLKKHEDLNRRALNFTCAESVLKFPLNSVARGCLAIRNALKFEFVKL